MDTVGRKALFDYLKSFPLPKPTIAKKTFSSKNDERFRFGDFIVYLNRLHGYIGIEKVYKGY